MIINLRRIWPPPRWPLIHEAKRVFKSGGREAFEAWADNLSLIEKEELIRQLSDLLSTAVEKVMRDEEERDE